MPGRAAASRAQSATARSVSVDSGRCGPCCSVAPTGTASSAPAVASSPASGEVSAASPVTARQGARPWVVQVIMATFAPCPRVRHRAANVAASAPSFRVSGEDGWAWAWSGGIILLLNVVAQEGWGSAGGPGEVRPRPQAFRLPVRWSRPLPGEPSSVTVIRDAAGRYFASFVVQTDPAADAGRFPPTGPEVGIDLGLAAFAVLSDGTKVGAPRFLRQAQKKIGRLQRAHSRKQKGSKNQDKARRRWPARTPRSRTGGPTSATRHPQGSSARTKRCTWRTCAWPGSAGPGWPNRFKTPGGPPSWPCWNTRPPDTGAPSPGPAGSSRPASCARPAEPATAPSRLASAAGHAPRAGPSTTGTST